MRTGSMIFSLLQVPRCRIHGLANYWGETFHSLGKAGGNNSSVRLLSSRIYGLQEGQKKKWTRRPITTNTKGTGRTKSRSTNHEILSEAILTSPAVNVNKEQPLQLNNVQYCNLQEEIAKDKDVYKKVTVMVFDIETTGLSRENDRIIEIACRDLSGGENSTFQTLVNPQRYIPNSHIHHIYNKMVNRPEVPRMDELIPILLHFIRSRQKPGGYVLFVAHNARIFDVPFIRSEFHRHSTEIPPNWLFVDTLPLAKELFKARGTKSASATLSALSEHYGIKVDGPDHRAMVDVDTLSQILHRLTYDLKLELPDLVKKSFTESEIHDSKKKKNSD
ncbi:hypothetical protein PIB30_041721 [Stylosanthes scabra]|uniref:Exonuclease domain-containing protein n=1 Tax=Stylosanthes scabra TaxID=79078 RepID=A0ABU6XGH1_9FABA|nr:hypothetical protein [Stylosanthes scabra]